MHFASKFFSFLVFCFQSIPAFFQLIVAKYIIFPSFYFKISVSLLLQFCFLLKAESWLFCWLVSKSVHFNLFTGELSTFALIMTNHVFGVISTICFLWLECFVIQNFRNGDLMEIKRHLFEVC